MRDRVKKRRASRLKNRGAFNRKPGARNVAACLVLRVALSGMVQGTGSAAAAPLPGQIVADPEAPAALMRNGGEHVFICGPGDPEDFLYRRTLRPDGTRDGDQRMLIRRLLENGGNCLYFQAVRSHGGDGTPTHNPFIGHDPSRGVNLHVLDQWGEWLQVLGRVIRGADPHGHLIGNHHHSGIEFKSRRPGGPFDHFAMQLNTPVGEVYTATREALAAAHGEYHLLYAENTRTPHTVDGWRHQAWRE